jgi:hypothetical protein
LLRNLPCDETRVCDNTLPCDQGIILIGAPVSPLSLLPVTVQEGTFPGVYPSGGSSFPGATTFPGIFPSGGPTYPGRGNRMSLIPAEPIVLTVTADVSTAAA